MLDVEHAFRTGLVNEDIRTTGLVLAITPGGMEVRACSEVGAVHFGATWEEVRSGIARVKSALRGTKELANGAE